MHREVLANAVLNLIFTLRRLGLTKAPDQTKYDTDEIFNAWMFANKHSKRSE